MRRCSRRGKTPSLRGATARNADPPHTSAAPVSIGAAGQASSHGSRRPRPSGRGLCGLEVSGEVVSISISPAQSDRPARGRAVQAGRSPGSPGAARRTRRPSPPFTGAVVVAERRADLRGGEGRGRRTIAPHRKCRLHPPHTDRTRRERPPASTRQSVWRRAHIPPVCGDADRRRSLSRSYRHRALEARVGLPTMMWVRRARLP